MQNIIKSFIQNVLACKKYIIPLLVSLLGIRVIGAFLTVNKNFGEVWRAGIYGNSQWYSKCILLIIPLWAIYVIYKNIDKTRRETRISLWVFFMFSFLVHAIVISINNGLLKGFFYAWVVGMNVENELAAILKYIFFFDSPYIFWWLCFMVCGFFISMKINSHRFAGIFFIVPFFTFSYLTSILLSIVLLPMGILGFIGTKKFHRTSSFSFYALTTAIIAAIMATLHSNPLIELYRWLFQLFTLCFTIVPALLTAWQLKRDNTAASNIISWAMLPIFFMAYSLIAVNADLGHCYLHYLYIFSFFTFANGIAVTVTLITFICAIAGLFSKILTRPLFILLSVIAVLFYAADVALFVVNGLRMDLNSLFWLSGMHADFMSKTILSYFTTGIVITIAAAIFALITASKLIISKTEKKEKLPVMLIAFIIVSQLSGILYDGFLYRSIVLKDTSTCVLASIVPPQWTQEKKPYKNRLINELASNGGALHLINEGETPKENDGKLGANLIVVALESTFWRYISMDTDSEEATWPLLGSLKDRMEIFPLCFSAFPETGSANFSILCGLYPTDTLYLMNTRTTPQSSFIRDFKKAGYKCMIFASSSIYDSGMGKLFTSRGFDEIYTPENMQHITQADAWTWGIKEEAVVNSLVKKVSETRDDPFCIYYLTISPHAPFENFGFKKYYSEEDFKQEKRVGRYRNILRYQDEQLYRMITEIDKLDLDRETYFILVGDHGEMLGENGQFGHGWNLEPTLVNVPLLIIKPEASGLKINKTLCSQIDILPTIRGIMGTKAGESGLWQGRDLRHNMASAPILISSVQHLAVAEGDLFYHFKTKETNDPARDCDLYKISVDPSGVPSFSKIPLRDPDSARYRFAQVCNFYACQSYFLNEYSSYLLEAQQAGNSGSR